MPDKGTIQRIFLFPFSSDYSGSEVSLELQKKKNDSQIPSLDDSLGKMAISHFF